MSLFRNLFQEKAFWVFGLNDTGITACIDIELSHKATILQKKWRLVGEHLLIIGNWVVSK